MSIIVESKIEISNFGWASSSCLHACLLSHTAFGMQIAGTFFGVTLTSF